MISEINDTLIRRAIQLSLNDLADRGSKPPVPFCWMALGSEGREEQLLRTDQDNAILYANPGDDEGVAELENEVPADASRQRDDRCHPASV